MNKHICAGCGAELHLVGPQTYVTRGVEVDLMHCNDPDCVEFERTRSYDERPIAPDQLAKIRAELAAITGGRYQQLSPNLSGK